MANRRGHLGLAVAPVGVAEQAGVDVVPETGSFLDQTQAAETRSS